VPDLIEKCSHCGATTGLIADDWGVWHCLDRAGCLDRLELIGALREELRRAEARTRSMEKIAHEAITAVVGNARALSLNAAADTLEAQWYSAMRPSPLRVVEGGADREH